MTLLEIVVPWEGSALRLSATHRGSHHDRQQPQEEVPVLLHVLHSLAATPHLLLGDFNALHPDDAVGQPPCGQRKRGEAARGAPRQAIRSLLEAGYVDCYRQVHPEEPGYTYPASSPWLRLDSIFASARMAARLATCDVLQGTAVERASDYRPVWAEFR
jgi:exodeoxyribonuclease-3